MNEKESDPIVSCRDKDATRTKILNSASEEFAKFGYISAKTEAIAASTNVTKAMIYYYFGNKENLYIETIKHIFLEPLKNIEILDLDNKPPIEALELILNQMHAMISCKPTMSYIMMYEALQNGGKYYKQVGLFNFYHLISNIIQRGIDLGIFKDLDPKHTAVNIVGTCIYYFCSAENIKHLWDDNDLLAPDMLDRHKQSAFKLILNGLLI